MAEHKSSNIRDKVQQEFWKKQLHPEKVDYSVLYQSPLNITSRSGETRNQLTFKISTIDRIRSTFAKSDIALFTFMAAAIQSVFYRYLSHPNIGITTSGFNIKPDDEGKLPLLLISDFTGEESFRQHLIHAKNTILDSYKNQDLCAMVVEDLQESYPAIGFSYEPIQFSIPELKNCRIHFELQANYELVIHFYPHQFQETFIDRLYQHLNQFLNSVLDNPDLPIRSATLLSEEEELFLLNQQDTIAYPEHETIVSLFEKQVEATPENTALKIGNQSFTYSELNKKANQLSHTLIGLGVKNNDLVGIISDRSPDMIIGLLAIIKAGAAYVPIDPGYPLERKKYTLDDSKCSVLLTQRTQVDELDFPGSVVFIEDEKHAANQTENPNRAIDPDHLAYIIYTSGTTGNPKGVMIRHFNLVRLFFTDQPLFDFNDSDIWTMFHSFCFDFSVWEMYGALLFGGKLILVPKETSQNPEEFNRLCAKEKVTILNQTPGAFYNFIAAEEKFGLRDSSARMVIFGGEALNPAKLRAWNTFYPSCGLINMYGITETTVHVTYKKIGAAEIQSGQSNIGKPIPTLSMLVLDQHKNMLPIGVPGELYIRGKGLALGYLNREELTRERFIQNPYDPTETLYRSGDLAKRLPNGDYEYLGRTDQQVKIRGFRIETGEIENALTRHPAVKNALILARKSDQGNDDFLTAYFIRKTMDSTPDLRSFLSEFLPDYMVPSFFVELQEFPLTSNGKIDKTKLPDPKTSMQTHTEYAAPSGEREETLVKIWHEVLNIDPDGDYQIGIHDNFFDLGGHSLKATIMLSKINKRFESNLRVKDIFTHPTIHEIAELIGASDEAYIALESVPEQPNYDLSYSQKQIWVVQQLDKENIAYNIFGSYKLTGELDEQALQQAFQELILRHDALRSNFVNPDGIPKMVVHADRTFELEQVDFSKKTNPYAHAASYSTDYQHKPFDLEKELLLRAVLLKTGKNEHLLTYGMHHIISDGWTMNIIIGEVIQLYNFFANPNNKYPLPKLRFQYKDFLAWENRMLSDAKREEYKTFWEQHFQGELQPVALPLDYPRPLKAHYSGRHVSLKTEPDLSDGIYQTARKLGITVNVFTLAAFNIFLSKISGQESITVRSITTGRNHEDLSDMVGYFIRVFGIKNSPYGQQSVAGFMEEVNQRFVDVMDHNIYPYEQVINDLADKTEESTINVDFAVQNLSGVATENGQGLSGLIVSEYSDKASIARNDLLLTVFDFENTSTEGSEPLEFDFNYNTDLFSESKIKWFASCFKQILHQLITNPEQTIADVVLSTGTEPELFQHLELNPADYSIVSPLTSTQRDIYLDCLINPEGRAQQLALFTSIREVLEIDLWETTILEIENAFEVLRSEIISKGNDVYQAVRKPGNPIFKWIDLSSEKLKEDQIHARMMEIGLRKNHLNQDLCRFYLVKIDDHHFINLIGIHHIFFDGVSGKTFFELAERIYQSKKQKGDFVIPESLPFSQYVRLHNNLFDTKAVQSYWAHKFSKIESLECLNANRSANHVTEKVLLDQAHLSKVTELCQTYAISVPMYFKGIFALLVKSYCNSRSDFYIRELLSGQTESFSSTLGCFYHTLPTVFDKDIFSKTVREYFEYVKLQKKELGNHQNISILLQNQLIGEEKVYFYFNFSPFYKLETSHGTRFYRESENTSEKDVELKLEATVDGFQFRLDYNESRFHSNRFIHRMMHLSDQILNGQTSLQALRLLLPEEINPAPMQDAFSFPDTTLHGIFEKTATLFPNRIALKSGSTQLTYQQLDKRSNQLANYIVKQQEVYPDSMIGILVGRSERMLIAILAVLKTGAAYVPIDPDYPQDRIDHIISDSGITLLLTENGIDSTHITFNGISINIEDQIITEESEDQPQSGATSKNLAYIIYTSGSTGLPKGSLIEHRNAVSLLVHNQFNTDHYSFDFDETDVWTLFHSFCFDFSIWEIFGALLYGGRLNIVPKEIAQNPLEFGRFLSEERVTILNQIPSVFLNVAHEILENKISSSLRYVIFGGEALKPATLKKWHAAFPDTRLINMYGITETTVHVTYKEITPTEMERDESNIGKPIPSLNCFIMNQELNQLPDGIAGEICITGHGVSRGYLGKKELSSARFPSNPFDPQQKLYRSGDLGLILPNGDLEYLGRMDQQVKIRGYRIELGEVENALLKHPQVEDAVVIVQKNSFGENEIIAYPKSNASLSTEELRYFVGEHLPAYMIPSWFVVVTQFPKTPIGKIDYKSLPLPTPNKTDKPAQNQPESELEHKLSHLWKAILGLKEINTTDSFFELGGQSLKAAQLVNQIEKEFEINVPLRQLFTAPTIKDTAFFISQAKGVQRIPLKLADLRAFYPVSPAQNRLYIINQFEGIGTAYNMPVLLKSKGNLDFEKFSKAVYALIQRHESLRTSFQMHAGEAVQAIHRQVDFEVEYEKLTDKNQKEVIRRFIQPFDLSQAPLFRSKVVELSQNEHLLLFDLHHIIGDGFSNSILLKDFIQLYNGALPDALEFQYKDFSVWQSEQAQSGILDKQKEYWVNRFKNPAAPLNLITDHKRPSVQDYSGNSLYFELDPTQSDKVKKLVISSDTTLFMVLLAAYNILLSKYTGQEDVVVGAPVLGRTQAELEHIVGVFVNTLALRNAPEANKSFTQFLEEVKLNTLDSFQNQDYPFEELVEVVKIERDLSRNPLFDTTFSVQNISFGTPDKMHGLELRPIDSSQETIKFDLTVNAYEGDQIGLSFAYRTSLFEASGIERMARHFGEILNQVLANPSVKIQDITLVQEEEKKQLLASFNRTNTKYPKDKTILDLINEHVQSNPNAIALEFEGSVKTYLELEEDSNKLANYLIKTYSIGKSDIIGILQDRSEKMILSILAVLKTGAAYLPVDTALPDNRIAFILSDAETKLILSDRDIAHSGKTFLLQRDWQSAMDSDVVQPDVKVIGDQLAYIIYTSGSTGRPKGCMLRHSNLYNYTQWATGNYFHRAKGHFALYTSISFDLTITSIFGALCTGQSLDIYSSTREINSILAEMFSEQTRTDSVKITPAHISLLQHLNLPRTNIQVAIVGGEQLTRPQIELLRSLNPEIQIFNEYGPTETTVGCIVKEINPSDPKVLIGQPIANTEIYITDSRQQLVPIGLPGEIIIGGNGVAQGYLNRPDLTRERFVPNTFKGTGTMYKTGDLARWLPNGEIEFLGRIDQQVKIRGYRIEPEEIEAQILKITHVREAVTDVKTDASGEHYLCAYFVGTPTPEEIRKALTLELPEYMVPTSFVPMDKIPLTSNGKVNRAELPDPGLDLKNRTLKLPSTETEKTLLTIWKEILGQEHIGIEDNFFSIGGHSLKATRVISEVYKRLDARIELGNMFTAPTVEMLAKIIDSSEKGAFQAIPIAHPKELYEISNAQKRLWLVDQMSAGNTAYNMGMIFRFEGKIDERILEKTVTTLCSRHESLRTIFVEKEGKQYQKIITPDDFIPDFAIKSFENQEKALDWVQQEWSTPFDLTKGPLIRVKMARFDSELCYFSFFIHHIIGDGWSVQVLRREIVRLYNDLINKHPVSLQPITIQYKDYSEWINREFSREKMEKHQAYWKEKFSYPIPVLNLPYDFERPMEKTYHGDQVSFSVDQNTSEELKKLGNSIGGSLFMVLLTALNGLLYRYTGQPDLVIGTPTGGREHPDLKNIIGFLVNTLAIKTTVNGNLSFLQLLEQIKQHLLEDFRHQDYPFDQLVDDLSPHTLPGRSPLFNIMFAMQGMADDPDREPVGLKDIKTFRVGSNSKVSQFDLVISATAHNQGINVDLVYNTDLFRKTTIESFAQQFKHLLTAISLNPFIGINQVSFKAPETQPVGDISILDENGALLPIGIYGKLALKDQEETILTGDLARILSSGTLEILNPNPTGYWLENQFVKTVDLENRILENPQVLECKMINRNSLPVACMVLTHEKHTAFHLDLALPGAIEVNVMPFIPLDEKGEYDIKALINQQVPSQNLVSQLEHRAALINPDQEFTGLVHPLKNGTKFLHLMDLVPSGANWESKETLETKTEQMISDKSLALRSAYVKGAPISYHSTDALTLPKALINTSERYPDKGIVFINPDNTEHFQSYPDLLESAKKVANGLYRSGLRPKDPIILQIEDQKDYFSILWGCIVAGIIPVTVAVSPTYEEENSIVSKLIGIWELLDQPYIIASRSLVKPLQQLPEVVPVNPPSVLVLEDLLNNPPISELPQTQPEDVVFYQLSSGSTGIPKCVQETSKGVIGHIIGSQQYNGYQPDNVSCNWIPFDHVGSIIMFHLKDLYIGIQQIQLGTDNFLSDPLRWLDQIEKHKVTHTWSPNFGYKLVAEGIQENKDRSWDLSSLQLLLNGGEQVTFQVVKQFLDRTNPFGIKTSAMQPAYGMAEVCTGLTYQNEFELNSGFLKIKESSLNGILELSTEPNEPHSTFICVGGPRGDSEIRITDENNQLLSERKIGRIQIMTPSITPGYLKNPEANKAAFLPDGWYNTGDLGFIWDKKLYVTGREKEMIIIRGTHYYYFEIEDLVSEIDGVEPTFVGSCPIEDARQGTEGLAIFFVPKTTVSDVDLPIETIRQIKTKITSVLGISPGYIIPVSKKEFPKTTSGKIQRNALKQQLRDGKFDPMIRSIDLALQNESNTLPDWFFIHSWEPKVLKGHRVSYDHILVFTNHEALIHQLVQSDPDQHYIQIAYGDRFEHQKKHKFIIRADHREDYNTLIASFSGSLGIIHAWNFEQTEIPEFEASVFEQNQLLGIFSLTHLSATINALKTHDRIKILILNPTQNPIAGATQTGFVKTSNQEQSFRTILLNIPPEEPKLSTRILQELMHSNADEHVSIQNHFRKVSKLKKVNFAGPVLDPENPVAMEPNGTYLITGALGGIGQLLATHLIQRYDANLLLIGRSEIPNTLKACGTNELLRKKFRILKDLQSISGNVKYKNLDINQFDDILEFIQNNEAPLSGIIHLAGELPEINEHWENMASKTLDHLTSEDYKTIFDTKVYGTVTLSRLLNFYPNASFIGFSSVNSFFGGYAYAPYSAASSFMDDYLIKLRNDGYATQTINWSMWDEVGMNENNQYKSFTIDKGFFAISPQQGINAFETALHTAYPQFLVGIDDHNPYIQRYLKHIPQSKSGIALFYESEEKSEQLLPALRPLVRGTFGLQLINVPSLPRTSSNSVDKIELFNQIQMGTEGNADFVQPETPTEIALAKLWSELLHKSRIGNEDNFFEFGGDSLKATQLSGKIHKELNAKVELRVIFSAPTIKALAKYIDENSDHNGDPARIRSFVSIPKVEERDAYPLSPAQNRMFILNQLDPAGTAYNMPAMYRIEGPLDESAVEQSFLKLVQRHESLRTRFLIEHGEAVQKILPNPTFKVPVVPCREDEINQRMAEFVRSFDLHQAPLLRVQLLKLSEQRYVLMTDMHHIISDGVSISILIKEFSELYAGVLPTPLRLQYKDFACWQQNSSESGQMEFWKNRFSGTLPDYELPLDYPRPAIRSFEGDVIHFELNPEETKAWRQFIRETGSTLFISSLAILNVLLSKYVNSEDIIVGTPVAGRAHADLENIIGMFVNSLAMRNAPVADKSFLDFHAEVKESTLASFEHQNYPLEELINTLDIPHDLTRNPLFDVFFAVQNVEMKAIDSGALRFTPISPVNHSVKFDLSVVLTESEDKIFIHLAYCTKLFKASTMERIAGHFRNLIDAVCHSPAQPLSSLSLTGTVEKETLLYTFGNTQPKTTGEFKSLVDLFEHVANQNPEKPAVLFKERELTFEQVRENVNKVHACLIANKITPGSKVALFISKSDWVPICTLGILKSGATLVPLDPFYPRERIEYILTNSKAQVIITDLDLEEFGLKNTFPIRLEELSSFPTTSDRTTFNAISPSETAYILYTSGTTGNPKGVEVSHQNISSFMEMVLDFEDLGSDEVMPLVASNAFDISFFEMFHSMFRGGCTQILAKDEIIDAGILMQKLQRSTLFHCVPALMRHIIDAIRESEAQDKFTHVKEVYVGGDLVPVRLLEDMQETFVNAKIRVLYGPTEATIFCTIFDFDPRHKLHHHSIGKPVSNSGIMILDSQNRLQPVGITGEICISGMGVSKGYLGLPEMTNEKFIRNPFHATEKIYKSGDVGRWNENGEIEFIGRNDSQVKIRGFRIELGEIESRINDLASVKEGIVLSKKAADGNNYLVAYVILTKTTGAGQTTDFSENTKSTELTTTEIKEALTETLPDYMIPTGFIFLDEFPLTSNQKIDRKALLNIDDAGQILSEFVAPEGIVELQIAELWKDLLKAEQISRTDHFFNLGGHSLKATQLVAKIRKKLNIDVGLKDIFEHPVLKDLAEHVNNIRTRTGTIQILPAPVQDHYPVSHSQNRLWVLDKLNPQSVVYNMPLAFVLEGELDRTRLESALKTIIERHESLRTGFVVVEDEPRQFIRPVHPRQFELHILDVSEMNDPESQVNKVIHEEAHTPFHLENDNLLRTKLIKERANRFHFLFTMHHIISDGWSMQVFVRELMQLYQNPTVRLPELKIQYKDFAVWQRNQLTNTEEGGLRNYWSEKMKGNIPVLDLPYDFARPERLSYSGKTVSFELEETLDRTLKNWSTQSNTSMFVLLTASVKILLYRYTNENNIIIGSPVAGRNHDELTHQIGFFVNTLVLKDEIYGEDSFTGVVEKVKQTVIDGLGHQEYPYDQLVEDLQINRSSNRNPMFDVMVSMQNLSSVTGTDASSSGNNSKDKPEMGIQANTSALEVSKFDLTFVFNEEGTRLNGGIEYATDLFREETIIAFRDVLLSILEQSMHQPLLEISKLELISSGEDDSQNNDAFDEDDTSVDFSF